MKLSILVASIPERITKIKILDFPDIEFLIFTDNKKRSIGLKRQALLDIAKGDYIIWLDDDDEITDDFITEVLLAIESQPDVICFNHEAWINGKIYKINVSIKNKDEQLHDGEVMRKPLCSSVWKRSIANLGKFPDTMYGEDAVWADQLHPKTEIRINKFLHKYIYEDSQTAAIVINKTTQKKTCIVSFCSTINRSLVNNRDEDYNEQIKHLIDSVKKVGFETDFLIFSPDHPLEEYNGVKINKGLPPNCKPHSEVPFMFKPALVMYARSLGYETIIWCDSTIQLLRHPEQILLNAGTNGIVAWDNLGHPLLNYINNAALEALNIGINNIGATKQIMACVIVFDTKHDHINNVINQWYNLASKAFINDNTTREGFIAHRHDQAVISYLLKDYALLPYGSLCYSPNHLTGEYETIFVNKI